MTRRKQVDVLRDRRDVALLKAQLAALNRRAAISSRYDAVEPNRARRQTRRETLGEGGIYDMSRRLAGCNLGRDLERNYSPARAMLHQFRVNVVGPLGKLRVNVENGGDEAAAWFNEDWAKSCDFRDDVDWSTTLQNILAGAIRDGDVLAVVDDGLVEDTGKLLTWESDQIAPVSDDILKDAKLAGFGATKQDNGILRDDWGRVLGYCTTHKRGKVVLDEITDVTPWRREDARLYRCPWRLNQGRGVPAIITPAANLLDLYEILSSELMTAKRASKQYAFVKRVDAVTDWDDPGSAPEFLPENDGRTATAVDQDGANQSTHTAKNYERLEALTGGLTDYLADKDTVEFPKIDRPNVHLADFLESVHGMSGAALGLARAYTILRADSSYTSFRGDMILSWVTFRWLQKHLERAVADWVAVKVLRWAQRKKRIAQLADGWERSLSWTWPTMPEVDEVDAENATAAALKNGTTDYAELLGPDWRKRLESLAEQTDVARDLGLPLKQFETASGGMTNPKKDGAPPARTTGSNDNE